jgi:hypothetical protein
MMGEGGYGRGPIGEAGEMYQHTEGSSLELFTTRAPDPIVFITELFQVAI